MKAMLERVRELLKSGEIAGFIGLRLQEDHPTPYLFTKDRLEELESMWVGGTRYPLNKVLLKVANQYPEHTLGVMVRGCDERGLFELFKWNQLRKDRVVPVGVACSRELAEACECYKPYPTKWVVGEKTEG